MSELISVIIPVYNVEKYVLKCVSSVIEQTYKNLEIILIDDGSTDLSGVLCDQLSENDDRIKVIHKKNGGLSDARNAGLDIATGEYIGFVDSDDYIFPEMYEYLLSLIQENKSDIAICEKIEFGENDMPQRIKVQPSCKILNREQAVDALADDQVLRSHVWNRLYSARLFHDLRYDVGKTYEDVYIMHRLFLRSNFVVISNEPLYCYRQRSTSILGTINLKKRLDLFWAYARRQEEISEQYPNIAKKVSMTLYNSMWDIINHAQLANKNDVKKVIRYYIKYVGKIRGKRDKLLYISVVVCIVLFGENGILSHQENR